MKKERGVIVGVAERKRTRMTPHTQHATEQEDRGKDDLVSLLQEGQSTADRVLLHSGLLQRRLQLGADPADLLQIVHAIQFAIEDLQTLLRSALQAVTLVPGPVPTTAEATEASKPLRTTVVDLRALLTRCAESIRQRAQQRGVSMLCDIAPDLSSLTTDPERLAQVFSLLLEQAVGASSKGGVEVRVCWADGALVIDVYDAGRGISTETYVSLHNLVGSLHGTLVVTRELGVRSRVELAFPPTVARGNGAPQVAPANTKENGR
jgi:signal transduction histidine kinase